MKKNFKVGQRVIVTRTPHVGEELSWENSWVGCMDRAVSEAGTITSVSTADGIRINFDNPESNKGIKGEAPYGIMDFPEEVLELESSQHILTQTIVNTKGLLVVVRQKRDALGRFVKGGTVKKAGTLRLSMIETYTDPDISFNACATRVFVQYSFSHKDQEQHVTVLRLNGGKPTCKTFLNTGL